MASRRAATRAASTADELEVLLDGLLRLDGASLADVTGISLASVVPALTGAATAMADRRGLPLMVAAAGNMPMPIRVQRPAEVGRRPPRQRAGGGPAVRHSGHRRRLRHGHDVRLRGPRRSVRRRRHRPRPRAGPRGARIPNRPPASHRAHRAGARPSAPTPSRPCSRASCWAIGPSRWVCSNGSRPSWREPRRSTARISRWSSPAGSRREPGPAGCPASTRSTPS